MFSRLQPRAQPCKILAIGRDENSQHVKGTAQVTDPKYRQVQAWKYLISLYVHKYLMRATHIALP